MKIFQIALIAAALATSGAAASYAADGHDGPVSATDMKDMGPLQKASMEAMDKMNKAMMNEMNDADPDLAWMKSMAAHHQGAVDMSEAAIKYSKDESVIREAHKTKAENEKSIREIQAKIKKGR